MSEGATATPATRVVDGRQVPEAGTWEIDPSHQAFEFIARHLMAKVRGRFTDFQGQIQADRLISASTFVRQSMSA